MNKEAIDALIEALQQVTTVASELRYKVEAAETVLKETDMALFDRYMRTLGAFRDANRAQSAAVASGKSFDKLRSALSQHQ